MVRKVKRGRTYGTLLEKPGTLDWAQPERYAMHELLNCELDLLGSILSGKAEVTCQGCRISLPFRNMTIDHVIPVSRGVTDHIVNVQLLCGA